MSGMEFLCVVAGVMCPVAITLSPWRASLGLIGEQKAEHSQHMCM